jgi:23S rRNA (guanine2445-N2)-methyltransferase / 23S rRNA (guanine2069-N7)-methyltransferase
LSNTAPLQFVATVARGLADLTAAELRALGAEDVREFAASVSFSGDLALGYRACLWSRTASRILLRIAEFAAPDADAMHAAAMALDWQQHLAPGRTLACEFTGQHPTIANTHFGALRLKDAICDQLRAARGLRPDVATVRPDLPVLAHASGTRVTLYLDMAGEGMHRRGYRIQAGEAPLRENVAAGMLLRARWPRYAAGNGLFLDPLCGSGTLVIEAAMLAADMAPGLQRDYWGFNGWLGHDTALWQSLRTDALGRIKLDRARTAIAGSDADPRALSIAEANAVRAGVSSIVSFKLGFVKDARPQAPGPGLVATNPPYGERLDDVAGARAVHQELGEVLREQFAGWEAAVLTGAEEGARALGLRTYRTHDLWNGALACRLLRVDVSKAGKRERAGNGLRIADPALAATPGAQMFANRLRKNIRQLRKQAERAGVGCYRLYDADMPEYAFAIDRYALSNGDEHLYVQEYAAPATIEASAAARRRAEALAALPEASGVAAASIHLRTRKRQTGDGQYERLDNQAQFHTVEEAGLKFLVNFNDYLDTGLFLDHRLTRARLRAAARDARVLNLFCYTATASVHAAAGGAASTLSIDLSNTYLDWAAANFKLNALDVDSHRLLRADCREWLAAAGQGRDRYELIFLDPPTFSNSKRMEGVLDTQRDHPQLIADCMRLLAPGGLLVFSTNAQQFKIDPELAVRFGVEDISAATLPFDFARNPRIHRCFELRSKAR